MKWKQIWGSKVYLGVSSYSIPTQNHRITGVGRDVWGLPSPTLQIKQDPHCTYRPPLLSGKCMCLCNNLIYYDRVISLFMNFGWKYDESSVPAHKVSCEPQQQSYLPETPWPKQMVTQSSTKSTSPLSSLLDNLLFISSFLLCCILFP